MGLGMSKQESSMEYIDYLVVLLKKNLMKPQCKEAVQ